MHASKPCATPRALLAAMTAALALAGCAKTEPVTTGNVPPASGAVPADGLITLNDLDPITVAYPPGGVVLGQAYDFVAQRWLPSVCVSGKTVDLGAGEMTVKFKDLQDRQQVFESLKVSASGEGSIGVGSASASSDYAKSTDIKTERRNILTTIDSMKGGVQLMPPEGALSVSLTKLALDKVSAASAGARNGFRVGCGDGYVAAIRNGARLNAVLSYAMDATEMQESLKISASGSYGPAKAKASMERVRKDDKNTLNTEVTFLQIGGNRGVNPATPAEFVDKMGKFGNYSTEEAVPLEVVVLPYRVLGEVPAALKDRALPDLGVRGLAAHYWRLSDLAGLYSRASMNKGAYYHVFVPPEELVTKARALQNAALCVAQMLDICATEGTEQACKLDTLTERAKVRRVCLAFESQTTPRETIESLELAVGGTRAGAILGKLPEFKQGVNAQALAQWQAATLSSSAAFTAAAGASAASAAAAVGSAEGGAWQPNVYDVWFRNYARAPWPRDVSPDNTTLLPTDMNKLLEAFCAGRRLDCVAVAYGKLSAPDDKDRVARDALFKEFVVSARLFPVAAAVCDTQLSHPMCQLRDTLFYYVDGPGESGPMFGTVRGFTVLTAKAQPSAETSRRPDRLRDYYGCGRPPHGYPC